MQKEDIRFDDIKRWLFGKLPPEFLIEVLIRTLIIYLFLLLIIRLMGKRMTGQLTITELSVVITLGAIVSPVMQLPEKGIVFGIITLLCAYVFQRGLNLWEFRNEKIEDLTQGKMSIVVKDGILNLEELQKIRIPKEELFALLREQNIHNLGSLERVYLEASGILSIYKAKEGKAGLPIFPLSDPIVSTLQQEDKTGIMACINCGNTQEASLHSNCKICNSVYWGEAYTATEN